MDKPKGRMAAPSEITAEMVKAGANVLDACCDSLEWPFVLYSPSVAAEIYRAMRALEPPQSAALVTMENTCPCITCSGKWPKEPMSADERESLLDQVLKISGPEAVQRFRAIIRRRERRRGRFGITHNSKNKRTQNAMV